jgi:hypothetical protein
MLRPLLDSHADAVFGSRYLTGGPDAASLLCGIP